MLIFVPYLGSTLAATVTISGTGGRTAIEFGQGSQVAITCDTSITSSVDDIWYSTGTSFIVEKITLSGVDTRTNTTATENNLGCGGKTLRIRLFTGSSPSTTPATITSNSQTSFAFTVPTTTQSISLTTTGTGITGEATVTSNVGEFVFTLPTLPNLDASTITRVSIETE